MARRLIRWLVILLAFSVLVELGASFLDLLAFGPANHRW